MRNKFKLTFKVCWLILALVLALGVNAKGPAIAVLYPDVYEPYRSIFGDIIKGISSAGNGKIQTFALGESDEINKLESWLYKEKPDVVISLGSSIKPYVSKLPSNLSIVSGAALLTNLDIQQGAVGISLTPSPKKLFAKLKELAPNVQRISVVYHVESNGWLIDLARQAADELGLALRAIPASSARNAAISYQILINEQEKGVDAIWLLQADPTLDEIGLLPRLMNDAWNRNSVVFSSNPSHVKRGALFSLFPDNEQMGKSLLNKAVRVAKGESKTVEALENLLIAVNVRTAEHLNLRISRSQQRDFDLVFPNR